MPLAERSIIDESRVSTKSIRSRTSRKGADQVTNGIDSIDNARARSTTLKRKSKVLAILVIAVDGAHE